jgi:hypothetical protein
MKCGEIWWADLAEVRRLPAGLMRPIDDGLRLALSLE